MTSRLAELLTPHESIAYGSKYAGLHHLLGLGASDPFPVLPAERVTAQLNLAREDASAHKECAMAGGDGGDGGSIVLGAWTSDSVVAGVGYLAVDVGRDNEVRGRSVANEPAVDVGGEH